MIHLRTHDRRRLQPGLLMKLLAAAVLVLLPALAWLQYSWVGQIADADRERRARTLQTAAAQLAQDFDGEVGKAVAGLQLDAAMVEQQTWTTFAQRYQLWAQSAIAPDIVSAVYYVNAPLPDRPRRDDLPLRVWNPQTHTFDDTPWPDALSAIKMRFMADARGMVDMAGPRRPDRPERLFPQVPTGDEQSIVVPVLRITPREHAAGMPAPPPDVKLLGFEIIRLNPEALIAEVLPVMVRRHLYDDDGETEYIAAVVARNDPARVIYESAPGAAAVALQSPDATTPLLGPRMGPMVFVSREGRRGRLEVAETRVPPPPPPAPPAHTAPATTDDRLVVSVIEARDKELGAQVQARLFGQPEGHWRLAVKHRAGSLEAAVAAARTRNLAISSGILLLLATAIALIVVSARRADRLARQQIEFVAAVSHELRTPVSVIGAAAGNLADGVVGEPARVKKYGATIQTEARRLAETVERVLQLAGIAAGRAAASPSVVASHALIHDALTASRHDIDAAGVTVEVALPDALPAVRGDALALRSALQNLIGNAVKYSGDARWIRVSAATAGRAVRFTVEDRGLGIAAADLAHIFEPFYRGREAVSRQIQGSGLGLHLVARIAQAHGGSVMVDSEPGRGSRFTLELPAAPDTPAAESSRQASAAPAGA
jgi:signal transduction histidine kinase